MKDARSRAGTNKLSDSAADSADSTLSIGMPPSIVLTSVVACTAARLHTQAALSQIARTALKTSLVFATLSMSSRNRL